MKKYCWRSFLSFILSLTLVLSMTLTIFAETQTIYNPDGTVTQKTTDEKTTGTGGDITVTVEITENTTGPRNDGTDYESNVERTEITEYEDYRKVSAEWSEDGYSKTTEYDAPADITVEVPLKEGESNSDSTEAPEENPAVSDDGKTITTVTPGTVTVTTTDVTIEAGASEETDMDYVSTDTTTAEGEDIFLVGEYQVAKDENGNTIKVNGKTVYVTDENGNKVPIYYCVPDPTDVPDESVPETAEGYEYTLVGTGNSSQFYAAILFKTPGYEGEEPNYIAPDGTKYYTTRGKISHGSYRAEGVYIDGEKVDNGNAYGIWGNVAQYVLIDGDSGELITTYCADMNTYTQDGYSYNMVNVEDADYYTEDQAAMIRTVANNGYWGVEDDPSTPEAEYGSLEAMRQMMTDATDSEGNKVFTEDEIALLSDGIAMTATQYSIWTFSNAMSDAEFINCHWIPKDENDIGKGWSYAHLNNIPADKEASVALIFKLYKHLTNMEPTYTTGTTKDTIFTPESFVENIALTVVDKVAAEDHENNRDADKTNDAYYTNLTFALVVTPAERAEGEPQDSLLVSLVDSSGEVIAKGRIAGELQEGETLLVPDANGNYAFNNIVMVEGDQKFNLTLTGIQYLEEGVYLYTSEIRPDDGSDPDGDGVTENDDVSSQTMVGVAGGAHGLNLSMEITFKVDVQDEITVTERWWHDEDSIDYPPTRFNDPPPTNDNPPPETTPPEGDEDIPDDPVPMNEEPEEDYEEDDEIEILDEEVPLAEVPETGDASDLLMLVVFLSVVGLIALNLPMTKRNAA